jgi:hypothetical protein
MRDESTVCELKGQVLQFAYGLDFLSIQTEAVVDIVYICFVAFRNRSEGAWEHVLNPWTSPSNRALELKTETYPPSERLLAVRNRSGGYLTFNPLLWTRLNSRANLGPR